MKKILIIDACVRRQESRTKKLLDRAEEVLREGHPDWEFTVLNLMEHKLQYWDTERLAQRDALLAQGRYDAPMFDYSRQFAQADGIVVAAPFWDLSIPAVLKVYIENVSADGLTFQSTPEGLKGICRAQWLLFLTTRGGLWEGGEMELGSPYMEALCSFFGIDAYYHVYADGLDMENMDAQKLLEAALKETVHICTVIT